MNNEIKNGLSILKRLGNVLFWIIGLMILSVSFVAGYFYYADVYEYTLITCNEPNKDGYPEFENKYFKVYRYFDDSSEYPDAEYWSKCVYKIDKEADILKIVNSDSSVHVFGKFKNVSDIPIELAANYAIYNSIKFNPVVEKDRESFNVIFSDKLYYIKYPPTNYTVESYRYDIWKAIFAGLASLIVGLFFVFILYKVLTYIISGNKLLSWE